MKLEVPGRPVPKGRPRFSGTRAWTPDETRSYEETVAWHARAQRLGYKGPVRVKIALWSTARLAGDIDNYAKAILDGLVKGQAIEDDRDVRALEIEKYESMSHDVALIEIEQLVDVA